MNNNTLDVKLSAYAQFLEEGSSWIGIYNLDVFKDVDNTGVKKYIKFKYIEKSGDQIIDSYNFDISDLDSGKKYIILVFASSKYGRILDSYYFYKEDSNKMISEDYFELVRFFPNYNKLWYTKDLTQGIIWLNKEVASGFNLLPVDNILLIGIKVNNAASVFNKSNSDKTITGGFELSNLIKPIVEQLFKGNAFINFLRGTIFDGEYRLTDETVKGTFTTKITPSPNLYIEDKKFEKEWEKYKIINGVDAYTASILNRSQLMTNKKLEDLFPKKGLLINNGNFDSNDNYILISLESYGNREFRAGQKISIKMVANDNSTKKIRNFKDLYLLFLNNPKEFIYIYTHKFSN